MKRLLFSVSVILIAILLFSCDMNTLGGVSSISSSNSNSTNSSNTVESITNNEQPTKPTAFKIDASRLVYSYGDEAISLSVINTQSGSYTLDDITFICDNNELVGLNVDNSSHTFTGYGAGEVTLRAKCGDVYSSNTLTIVCLPDRNSVAQKVKSAISGSVYLGAEYDIGLNAKIKDYYSIQGLDEFVKINEQGMLEIIGIKGLSTVLRITDAGNNIVFEDFFIMNKSTVADAVRNALLEDGTIPHINADISNTMIGQIKSLDLSGSPLYSTNELKAISYFKELTYLNISGSVLSNLSFLAHLTSLEELVMEHCEKLISTNNGIDIATNLMGLTSLKKLSIYGSFATITRNVYDTITSMVLGGQITLKVTDTVWLDATSISAFSSTVFLSVTELTNHLNKNGGYIVPAKDCYHAIISMGDSSTTSTLIVNADNVSSLDLYGLSTKYYRTAIFTNNDLDLYMYNYNIYIPTAYEGVSSMGDNLNIYAMKGHCSIEGGSYEYYIVNGTVVITGDPSAGIYASGCSLYASENATLTVIGGYGWMGANGVPAKDSESSIKNGSEGGKGGYGIYCNSLTVCSNGITVKGGNGGCGGNGGDGHNKDIVQGGYNGGDGGKGGPGGDAVCCKTYSNPDKYSVTLTPGSGGGGGLGGDGYAAGSNGDDGGQGDPGKTIVYK